MKKRVLVVDDTPVIRDLLRLILETEGYEVSEAKHGREAMAHMQVALPDLVMTDLMMPVMTGQQLVQRMRSDPRTASVPILVVSANPNAAQMAGRVDAVVYKPFDRADLVAHVRALVLPNTAAANPADASADDFSAAAHQRFGRPGRPFARPME